MAEMPILPLYVRDLIMDTNDIPPASFGSYVRLLCRMWCERGTDLPMDMDKLARIAGVGPRQFKNKIWPDIAGYFMALEGGRITQRRLRKEKEKARQLTAKRKEFGKRGGEAKALNAKKTALANATDLPEQNPSIHIHITDKDVSDVDRSREITKTEKTDTLSPGGAGDPVLDLIPEAPPPKPKAQEYPEAFETFWRAWREAPRANTDPKLAAFKVWKRLGPIDISAVLAGVKRYKRSPNPQRGYHQQATRWLGNRGWEDDYEAAPSQKASSIHSGFAAL